MNYELQSVETFTDWLGGLDKPVKAKVLARLARVENGNFGDFKAISADLYELRCFFGGGIRVYYTIRDRCVVLLLAGGDKSTQERDIAKANLILNSLGL